MIQTIIFDIDGTVLNTERIYMQAWKSAGAARGIDIPHAALVQTRAVRAAVARECFQKYCGENFPYDLLREERVVYSERLIAQSSPAQLLMPHALQTLQALRHQGYVIAAATSTGYQKTVDHLAHAGILEYFDHIVGGDMVAKGKPEPDIFLYAAQLAGSSPSHCVVVGDSPADVLAAHAAGIPVFLIPDQVPANEQTTALSRRVLSGLDQLPDAIKELT